MDGCEDSICGTNLLTTSQGNISTLNFPWSLPPYSRCLWTITVTTGFIELVFTNFSVPRVAETDQCVDAVLVTMLSQRQENKEFGIWEYCGDIPLIVSSTSALSIEFRTGIDLNSMGFTAQYVSTGMNDKQKLNPIVIMRTCF